MEYGTPLCRYILARDATDKSIRFELAIHHSIFDGWSLSLILRTLSQAYLGGALTPLSPFSNFIKYAKSIDMSAARDFRQSQLKGADKAIFPSTMISPTSKSQIVTHPIHIPEVGLV
jgi:NRPS condensation-like uncharacterized protein